MLDKVPAHKDGLVIAERGPLLNQQAHDRAYLEGNENAQVAASFNIPREHRRPIIHQFVLNPSSYNC
jgi:hypothetical protein